MPTTYQIHPGIGIARLGNSPEEFCISPEEPAALPIACDRQGNPMLSTDGQSVLRVQTFKDAQGRIKRQAARFQIYVYDDENPAGRPLKIGDQVKGGGNEGVLVDIQWRVYLANKKAAWYEFKQLQGEHGYKPKHPRRNAAITGSKARQQLIIDPGPRIVNCTDGRSANFDNNTDLYAATFPPELKPFSIDTLGELKTDNEGRLLVLGGYGHSGTCKFNDLGQPQIDHYANNDGWFDDTSDGPVMARLVMYAPNVKSLRYVDVDYPAWVLVGYPAYAPQILDIVTMEDVLTDVAIREFADRPDLYGVPGTFSSSRHIDPTDGEVLQYWRASGLTWNPDFKPWFYRDIWPILFRPDEYTWLANVLAQSNYPHDQTLRGNFTLEKLATPPGQKPKRNDPFRANREFLFNLLRQVHEENQFYRAGSPKDRTSGLPLMPLLAGDNPLSNTAPSKFLRLTDYQLFLLGQWVKGCFYNEQMEGWSKPDPYNPYDSWVNTTPRDLDRGVLMKVLGGAFCPGGEVGWIIRNPSIYAAPFRIKADPDFYTFRETAAEANRQVPAIDYVAYIDKPLSQDSNFDRGLQPGDLTKYMALPWQSDFNECSMQDINITYESWNKLYPSSTGDGRLAHAEQKWATMWWPAHRPLQTYEVVSNTNGQPGYQMLNWSRGIPGTTAGDLKMVTAWSKLGFVVRNPYQSAQSLDQASPEDQNLNKYISVERNNEETT